MQLVLDTFIFTLCMADNFTADLRWLRTIHVWLHHKIKMLILAKVLSLPFLKESVFTKYLFIYLLQQIEAFNS